MWITDDAALDLGLEGYPDPPSKVVGKAIRLWENKKGQTYPKVPPLFIAVDTNITSGSVTTASDLVVQGWLATYSIENGPTWQAETSAQRKTRAIALQTTLLAAFDAAGVVPV